MHPIMEKYGENFDLLKVRDKWKTPVVCLHDIASLSRDKSNKEYNRHKIKRKELQKTKESKSRNEKHSGAFSPIRKNVAYGPKKVINVERCDEDEISGRPDSYCNSPRYKSKKNKTSIKRAKVSTESSKAKSANEPATWQKNLTSWNEEDEFEIEEILDCRRVAGKGTFYLVKWKGWPCEFNTYEPIKNLTNCNYLLMKYLEKRKPHRLEIVTTEVYLINQLKTHEIYGLMKSENFSKNSLRTFSENCFNIDKLFADGREVRKFGKSVAEELEYVIRCLITMNKDMDSELFLRAQNYIICLKLIRLRLKQLENLSNWENRINSLEKVPVTIENVVDLENFPDFEYVTDLIFDGSQIIVPRDPPWGCTCRNGCTIRSNCCGVMAGSEFAYDAEKKLRQNYQIPIYECNSKCKCSPTCPNRVVQKGRRVKLNIFKTERYGWGVKAEETIHRATFVCEYIGELVTESEAINRDVEYSKQKTSYLFDLDFNPDHGSNMYSIDTWKYGNIARFINHSCDPNLVVHPVWIDCLEPNLPRLAFFTKRDVQKGEELTFDYQNTQEESEIIFDNEDDTKRGMRLMPDVPCECNSAICRKWLFGGPV